MASYTFVDHWAIRAPIEDVFRHIADAKTYPQWWPVYDKVEPLSNRSEMGVGSRVRLTVKSVLGYRLVLEGEVVEWEPPRHVATLAHGQLEGTGQWELEQQGDTTYVTWTWIVATHHPVLNLLEPIAKPLFAWSHNDASSKGHRGLKQWLEKKP